MLREVDDQAGEREALRDIEPYYNNLYKQKMFFGLFGPKTVSLNGSFCPPGMARWFLKSYYKIFHSEFVPVGGNYTHPLTAKLQSKVFGTGKDITRRYKEQERTDLGSQVWFSRHQATGGLFHWAFVVHDLVKNSYTKYELCRVRSDDVKKVGMHFSKPVDGRDGNQYRFRSKPVFLDLDAREKHILQTGYPEDGTYHICLIGWTHMTRALIDSIGNEIMKDFGEYDLFWNNCQTFLRTLFERLHNHRASAAANYLWFQKNMRTAYRNKK